MPDQTIVCPKCRHEFPLSEGITRQIQENIRREFAAKSLKEREQIEVQAKREAEQTFQSELTDLRSQVEETQKRLKEAQAAELDLRRKQRELQESKDALELEVTRRVDEAVETLRDEHAKKEALLEAREKKIEEARAQIEDQLTERLKSEREKIEREAKNRAETTLLLEMKDLRAQNEKLVGELKSAQKMELEMRQSKRELEARAESLELEVARKVDEARNKIREDAIKQEREEHLFKDKEKDKQLEGLRCQIDELRRKAEQGSQQTQGEILELEIEDLLRTNFLYDEIEPVPKGKKGADVLQRVHTSSGQYCGTIIWESKRTKSWGNDWIQKLKDDQRSVKAEMAVIISTTLPKELNHFGYLEGVWISDFFTALGVATVLRSALIEIYKARQSLVGKSEKMDVLYDYLSGPEFRQRVEALVETFKGMKQDLDQEKIAFQKIWTKRDKQIQRILENTVGMYGDMQGIIGASLPEIKGLEPPEAESEDDIPF